MGRKDSLTSGECGGAFPNRAVHIKFTTTFPHTISIRGMINNCQWVSERGVEIRVALLSVTTANRLHLEKDGSHRTLSTDFAGFPVQKMEHQCALLHYLLSQLLNDKFTTEIKVSKAPTRWQDPLRPPESTPVAIDDGERRSRLSTLPCVPRFRRGPAAHWTSPPPQDQPSHPPPPPSIPSSQTSASADLRLSPSWLRHPWAAVYR